MAHMTVSRWLVLTLAVCLSVCTLQAALAVDGAPCTSNYGTAGAGVDSSVELCGTVSPNGNTKTTAPVTCAAGSITATSITVASAASFDSAGGIAVISSVNPGPPAVNQSAMFFYTGVSGNTFTGVTPGPAITEVSGTTAPRACTGSFPTNATVESLTSGGTLAPHLNALISAVQHAQTFIGPLLPDAAPTASGTCAFDTNSLTYKCGFGGSTKTLATIDNIASGVEFQVNKGAANGYAPLDAGSTVPYANLPVGSVASTVAAGDDSRLSDARTPTTHAASHLSSGSDPIPAASTTVRGTVTTTTSTSQVASTDDSRLSDARTPTAHAASHLSNGSDAIPAATTTARGTVTTTTSASQVVSTDDARFGTYLTGNQTVTLSGDITGSGTTTIPATLANSGVTPGTYLKNTVDAKGRVTVGATAASTDLSDASLVVKNNQANTFTTGAQDFSAVTSFKLQTGAGLAPTTDGLFGFDTTRHAPVFGSNSLTGKVVFFTGSTPGSGNCVAWGSNGMVADAGAACGTGGSGGGGNNSALFTSTADATVANSTSETSVIGSGIGSRSTTANYFAAGTSLALYAEGYLSSLVTDTLNIKIKAGSTIVAATGVVTPGAKTNAVWRLSALITNRTAGVSGTFQVNTILEIAGATLSGSDAQMVNTSTVVLDTTGTLVWDLTSTWGSASASDTITGTNFTMFTPGTGITDPGAGGLLSRTALNTVAARILAGTTPVVVTNGDGITGNPTIACPTCVTSSASLPLNQLLFGAGSQGSAGGDLTGDVTTAGGKTTTLANIPTDTPMAGALLGTAITAPGTPAAGKGRVYVDSTSKNLAVKDDAGVVKHGVQTKTPVASNFATGVNDAGVVSVAQPAASDLSNGTTGSGAVVLAGSPSLTTPSLGVASATSINKTILTPPASNATLTIADLKTLTVNNTLTFAGTDGSTLNIGAGGTLGSAAFTSVASFEVPLTFSTGLTRTTNTITVNTTQNISKLSNLTGNGFVTTSGGDGTLNASATSTGYANEWRGSGYASLNALVTDAGSTVGRAVIDTAGLTLSGDVTVPATLTLVKTGAGTLKCNGHSLTILGPIDAIGQFFDSDCGYSALNATTYSQPIGLSFLGNTAIRTFDLSWWPVAGDGTTGNRVAIQSALTALGRAGGRELFFPPGTYRIEASSTLGSVNTAAVDLALSYENMTLRGVPGKSILLFDNSAGFSLYNYKDFEQPIIPSTGVIFNNANAGDPSLFTTTASDAGTFTVGDWILVRTGETITWGSVSSNEQGSPDSEIHKVVSVNSGTGEIKLESPLLKSYSPRRYPFGDVRYPAFAPQWVSSITGDVVENFSMDGMTLKKVAPSHGLLMAGRYGVNFHITNNEFISNADTTGGWGFGALLGRWIDYSHNTFTFDAGTNTGTGILFWADVTNSDISLTDNMWKGRGTANFQFTEGAANIFMSRNRLEISTFAGAAQNIFGLSAATIYNLAVTDNQFVLDLASSHLVANILDFGQGLKRMIFARNQLTIKNPPTNIVLARPSYHMQWVGNVWTSPDTLQFQLDDPGQFGIITTTKLDSLTISTAIPTHDSWLLGEAVDQAVPATGAPAGWVNTRAGRAAPIWLTSTVYYGVWLPNQAYSVGAKIIDPEFVGNGHFYTVTTAGTTGADPPTFPTGSGATVASGSAVLTEAGTVATSNFRHQLQYVVPPTDNGHVYQILIGGTSGTLPTFPTGSGATVTDSGGVTYKEAGAAALFTAKAPLDLIKNGQIQVPAGSQTAPGLTKSGDEDTGIWWAASGVLDGVADGVSITRTSNAGLILVNGGALGWGSAGITASDTKIFRENPAVIRQGANVTTTPVTQTYKSCNGSGTDIAGCDLVFAAGKSTGTALPGALYLATSTEAGGSSSTLNASVNRWKVAPTTGHFLAVTDNTYDIGASGATRPRTIYAGTSMVAPAFTGTASLATALAADPAPCGANLFGTDTTAAGALICTQPSSSNLSDASNIPLKNGNNAFTGINSFKAGSSFSLLDPTDTSKVTQFDASGVAASTTRTVTLPNDNSGLVVYTTFAAPPATPDQKTLYVFTDATAQGVCGGGGLATAACHWNGSSYIPVGDGIGTVPNLQSVVSQGGIVDSADSEANAVGFGSPSGGHFYFFSDASSGPQMKCKAADGTACDFSNMLSVGRKWGLFDHNSAVLMSMTEAGVWTIPQFTSNGGVLKTDGSGVVAQVSAGSGTQVLHGGTAPAMAAVSLTADVSGILPSANGGSGANLGSAVQGTIPYFSATGVEAALATGTSGQCLQTQGASANPVFASTKAVLGTNSGTNLTTTHTLTLCGGGNNGSALGCPMPYAGTAKNLCCNASVAPTSTQTWVDKVQKNGSDTGITLTLDSTHQKLCDTTHTVAVAQLDLLTIVATAANTPNSSTMLCTLEYDSP